MADSEHLGAETTEAYMKRKGLKPGDVIGATTTEAPAAEKTPTKGKK